MPEVVLLRIALSKDDQALYSNQFPNARGMFLTCALRNVIDSSINFKENSDDLIFDRDGKDKILKLIEHCRIENNWGSLSFFENTLKEIMFTHLRKEES